MLRIHDLLNQHQPLNPKTLNPTSATADVAAGLDPAGYGFETAVAALEVLGFRK